MNWNVFSKLKIFNYYLIYNTSIIESYISLLLVTMRIMFLFYIIYFNRNIPIDIDIIWQLCFYNCRFELADKHISQVLSSIIIDLYWFLKCLFLFQQNSPYFLSIWNKHNGRWFYHRYSKVVYLWCVSSVSSIVLFDITWSDMNS